MVLGVYPMKPKPLKLEDIEIVRLSGGHSGGRKSYQEVEVGVILRPSYSVARGIVLL